MMNAPWPQQIQELLQEPEVEALRGKFHAHLTVALTQDEIAPLGDLCRKLRIKLTVVDLENTSGKTQTDVMVTCYYKDTEEGAVLRITDQLARTSGQLEEAGFQVIRAKLEHESQPTFPMFSPEHYHETHIKLAIPRARYDEMYQLLQKLGNKHGFVPSRNPLAQQKDHVVQFLNNRLYEGSVDSADRVIGEMLERLASLEVSVIETKRETVVFDTHQQLDRWWA